MKINKMIKEKIIKLKNKFFKNKNTENKRKKLIILILIVLWLFNIFLLIQNFNLNKKLDNNIIKKEKIFINRSYFNENISLRDYTETKYKIEKKWLEIIKNIRNLHKSPALIAQEFQNKELCAGYISELSQKIWWKKSIYSIWMQNITKWKLAQAWELPFFYEEFGWKILIDLWLKFDAQKNNYLEKITISDLKHFFAKSFSEQALFWDIWFLYSKTKYSRFLKNWNSNSHIVKNMWISNFEIIISKFDENKTTLQNFMQNLECNSDFEKYNNILENYKIYLNNKEIIFYKNHFHYLNWDNSLWQKIELKYLDKITYKDITLAHFFEWKSHVDSLFQFTCKQEFFPVNVISINWRMIEKM